MTTWTESTVFERLRAVFPSPAFVLLPQVRNQTGYNRRVRTCDALAASVWPSRGLYFVGIEIKVSLSDWKRELANPAKAEEIGRFCSRWYVAAPAGVVPEAELPEAWGLIEVDAKTARITKKSDTREASTPSMEFVCSVLRAATEGVVPVAELEDRAKAIAQQRVDEQRLDLDYRTKQLAKAVEEFQKASGVVITDPWFAGDIGRAVRFVREVGIDRVGAMADDLKNMAENIARQVGEAKERWIAARPRVEV